MNEAFTKIYPTIEIEMHELTKQPTAPISTNSQFSSNTNEKIDDISTKADLDSSLGNKEQETRLDDIYTKIID